MKKSQKNIIIGSGVMLLTNLFNKNFIRLNQDKNMKEVWSECRNWEELKELGIYPCGGSTPNPVGDFINCPEGGTKIKCSS